MCFAEIVAWQPPDAGSRPVPIGSRFIGVSLQPAIPRRVAPQQSPLPLHQSPRILAQSQSGEAIKCALNFRKDAAHAVARRWVAAGTTSATRRDNQTQGKGPNCAVKLSRAF